MRDLNELDRFRQSDLERFAFGGRGDSENGLFIVPSDVDGNDLRVMASAGGGWDHVSISRRDRCPTWEEMEQIAKLFFTEKETAVQYHVPPAEHINAHPYCLHWWRPNKGQTVPKPPEWMVGPTRLR